MVEAVPIIEGSEYSGDVLRKEIGPLVLDLGIKEEVEELLETGRFKIAAKVESVWDPCASKEENSKMNDKYSFPKGCTLQVDANKVNIAVQEDERLNINCELGKQYPFIIIVKRTNVTFELHLSPHACYRMQAQSNTHRDVITVALRMFCGKKLAEMKSKVVEDGNAVKGEIQIETEETNEQMKQLNVGNKLNALEGEEISVTNTFIERRNSSTSQSQMEQFEIFVKLNELVKKTEDLEQIRDDMKMTITNLQEDNKMKQTKLNENDQYIQNIQNQLKIQIDIAETYRLQHAQYVNEKLFLTQEQQMKERELKLKNIELEEQRKQIDIINIELDKKRHLVDEESAQKMYVKLEELKNLLNNQISTNNELEHKIQEQESKYQLIFNENETLQNEVNHFKRKYEALIQENLNKGKKLDSTMINKLQNSQENYASTPEKNDYSSLNNISSFNNTSPKNRLSKSQNQLQMQAFFNSGQTTLFEMQPQKESQNDINLLKKDIKLKTEENHSLLMRILQLESSLETISQVSDFNTTIASPKKKSKDGTNDNPLQRLGEGYR